MPNHHHCGCQRMPDNWRERLYQVLDPATAEIAISELMADNSWGVEGLDRYFAKVTVEPLNGHWIWNAAWPAERSRPRADWQGSKWDIVRYFRVLRDMGDHGPEIPLVRDCNEAHCVSPYHYSAGTPSPEPNAFTQTEAHKLWLALNPEPKFQNFGVSWARAWPPTCPRSHPLKVYGDPRRRNNYCAECKQLHNRWKKEDANFQANWSNGRMDEQFAYLMAFHRTWAASPDALARSQALWVEIKAACAEPSYRNLPVREAVERLRVDLDADGGDIIFESTSSKAMRKYTATASPEEDLLADMEGFFESETT